MALTYGREAAVDRVTVDRRLYLTEDRSRVVGEGEPGGRWLWAVPGDEVSRAEAERLGALSPEPAPAPEPEPEAKKAPAPANKSRRASNKAAG
jgi:hypothetical protein